MALVVGSTCVDLAPITRPGMADANIKKGMKDGVLRSVYSFA